MRSRRKVVKLTKTDPGKTGVVYLPPKYKKLKKNLFMNREHSLRKIRLYKCECPASKTKCDEKSDCRNRLNNVECPPYCGKSCANRRIASRQWLTSVKIKPAGSKGKGLFATRSIEANKLIAEYTGKVYSTSAFNKISKTWPKHYHDYTYSLSNEMEIDASTCGSFVRYANHSCEPNCYADEWLVDGYLCIAFFTFRNITPGEELTIDYNMSCNKQEPKKCFCQSENCRGTISSKPAMDKEIATQKMAKALRYTDRLFKSFCKNKRQRNCITIVVNRCKSKKVRSCPVCRQKFGQKSFLWRAAAKHMLENTCYNYS